MNANEAQVAEEVNRPAQDAKDVAYSAVRDLNRAEAQRKVRTGERYSALSGESWHDEIAGHAIVGPHFNARLNQAATALRTVIALLARSTSIRHDRECDRDEPQRPLAPVHECGLMDAAELLAEEVEILAEQLQVDPNEHMNPAQSRF